MELKDMILSTLAELEDDNEEVKSKEVAQEPKVEIEKEEVDIVIINQSSDYNLTFKIKNLLEENLGFQAGE